MSLTLDIFDNHAASQWFGKSRSPYGIGNSKLVQMYSQLVDEVDRGAVQLEVESLRSTIEVTMKRVPNKATQSPKIVGASDSEINPAV